MHTDAFTRRRFYTQKLLHTEAFTHRRFYTQTLYTQTLIHTEAFAHRRLYTQTLLHRDAFTNRRLYTQTRSHTALLHTDAFTHRHFYTQTLLHRSFNRTDQIRKKTSVWHTRARFVQQGFRGHFKITIIPQFLRTEPHFVPKRCRGSAQIAILLQF